MNPQSAGRRAFTLIEMLITVAVLGVLAALLFPMASRSVTSARAAQSLANLKSIGTVMHLYAGDNNGAFPLVWDSATSTSWIATIWPYASDRRFPGTTPNALKGSIFYTPLAENGTTARTYGMNEPLQLKYPSRMYLSTVPTPSKVSLVGDVKTSGSFRPDQVNYRNNGLAHVLYIDGHTGAVGSSDVPVNTVSVFWTGVQSN